MLQLLLDSPALIQPAQYCTVNGSPGEAIRAICVRCEIVRLLVRAGSFSLRSTITFLLGFERLDDGVRESPATLRPLSLRQL